MHPIGDRRLFDQASHQKYENSHPDEQLEVGAKHVLEIARIACNIERAEPFDMRAGVVCEECIHQTAERRRCRSQRQLGPQTHSGLLNVTNTRVPPPHAVTRYN